MYIPTRFPHAAIDSFFEDFSLFSTQAPARVPWPGKIIGSMNKEVPGDHNSALRALLSRVVVPVFVGSRVSLRYFIYGYSPRAHEIVLARLLAFQECVRHVSRALVGI